MQVRYHRYDGLPIAEVVAGLLERLAGPAIGRCRTIRRDGPRDATSDPRSLSEGDAPPIGRPRACRVAEVIAALRELDQSRYSFVTDVGDSWFIGLELRADVFVAAGYYSSMGFAVPAALGRGIAEPSRRPFVIVGDGAFQMTGTELATHGRSGAAADRAAAEQRRLWHARGDRSARGITTSAGTGIIRPWPVPWAPRPSASRPPPSSAAALRRAEAAPGAYLIEAFTARDDLSPVMARIRTHVHSAFRINAAA